MDEFKKYRCGDCMAVFDEPVIRVWREDMNGDGVWFTWHELRCPICGSEEVEDAETDFL